MTQPPDKDNEFDDLIRAAAEEHHASGASPDWDNMEAMLDTHLPVGKDRRRKPVYWLLLPACLLLAGLYFFRNHSSRGIKTNNVSETPRQQPNTIVSPPLHSAPEGASNEAINNATKAPASTNNTLAGGSTAYTKNNSVGGHREANTNPAIAGRETPATNHLHISTTSKATSSARANELSNSVTEDAVTPGAHRSQRSKRAIKSGGRSLVVSSNGDVGETNDDAAEKKRTQTGTENEIAVLKDSTVDHPLLSDTVRTSGDPAPANKVMLRKNASEKVISVRKNIQRIPAEQDRFEIALVYAPELTTVRFTHLEKPGSAYGLLLTQPIFKKLSLQTGIIRSRKNYIVNGADYKMSYTPPQPFKLSSVQGYCTMYELPVNFKYTISQGRSLRVSAIAGVSSYFMMNESYTYKYNSYDSAYNRSRAYGSQKNYWLALATVAIGFEKPISPVFSFGVTPYLKIPFKGMGTGDLKLSSTGINFSLGYRPAWKR